MSAEHLVAAVPLAQTALWVGLIFWLVHQNKDAIKKLLELIRQRVEGGSSVEAGPLKIGARLEPQGVESQKAEAKKEAEEYIKENSTIQSRSDNNTAVIVSEKYLAEDLVIRALQKESQSPIQRNLQLSSSFHIDGMFTNDGLPYFVEVKIVSTTSVARVARKAATQIFTKLNSGGWNTFRIIVCLVYLEDTPATADRTELEEIEEEFGSRVSLRIFELHELRVMFGVE